MFPAGVALSAVGAAVLCGCGAGAPPPTPTPDINRVAEVRSSFGPGYRVQTFPVSGIDPSTLGNPQLPPGLTYTPTECGALVADAGPPPAMQGNMAATTAEGDSQRFIVIAVETSEQATPAPMPDSCRRVEFTGGAISGVVEVVEAPEIADAETVGTHRVVQQNVGGLAARGELYNYVARFGAFQVIVVAASQVQPGRPVAPVDTAQARELLSAAVAAVRG